MFVCMWFAGVHTDLVQQGLVSSSKPSPAILANDVVGPLLLEVSCLLDEFVLLSLHLLVFDEFISLTAQVYKKLAY